jgi:transcriptional regulator with XRE-family HTH domain
VALFGAKRWRSVATLPTYQAVEKRLRDRLAINARRIREGEGFSQEAVAERAGMSLRSYQRVEEGGTGPTSPRLLTVARVAVALNVDPVDLLRPVS